MPKKKNKPNAGRVIILLSSCSFFLAGCATPYAHRTSLPSATSSRESVYLDSVPPVAQKAHECGPASLESVIRHWKGNADAMDKSLYRPGTGGILDFSLAQEAGKMGYWSELHEEENQDLKGWLRKGFPPIVMLDTGVLWARRYHFVVLKGFDEARRIFYANTGEAQTQAIDWDVFEKRWKAAGRWCLLVCPPEKVDWPLDEKKSVELALVFERNGDLAAAEKLYDSVLAKNPRADAARFNLANVYARSGRQELAVTSYTELLVVHADRAEIANNLASVYYEKGRYEEAMQVIENAFKNGAPRKYDILDTAGMIACKLGRPEKARDYFLEAEKNTRPEDTVIRGLIKSHRDECGDSARP